MDRHLWLIGMMGSGKSATARLIAERWHVSALDTDDEVAARTGCSIAEFWGERGEQAFRDMETAAVRRLAAGPPGVVATGGGAVLNPANLAEMTSSGAVVWLIAPARILSERVRDGSGRPLLETDGSASRLNEILSERGGIYESAADVVVDTSEFGVEGVADRIEEWWTAS